MTDVRTQTETCSILTHNGIPESLAVGDCRSDVPCSGVPAADVAAVLSRLGFEVLGHLCWVHRGLWILAVRRRAEPC